MIRFDRLGFATTIVTIYTAGGRAGHTSFGSGGEMYASSGTGDIVGLEGTVACLIVPQYHMSGATLTAGDTHTGQTFASFGFTPST